MQSKEGSILKMRNYLLANIYYHNLMFIFSVARPRRTRKKEREQERTVVAAMVNRFSIARVWPV